MSKSFSQDYGFILNDEIWGFCLLQEKTQIPKTFPLPSHSQNNNNNPEHSSIFGFYFAFIIQHCDLTNDYRLENT